MSESVASVELEQRLAGDPDNLDLWLELASALEREGRSEDAIALCREVVLREPERSSARAMLTRLASERDDGERLSPVRPPGVRTSRRATLRGLFAGKNRERAKAAKARGIGEDPPPTAASEEELLVSFDRTEGPTLSPRPRRPSVVDITLSLFPGIPDDALDELATSVTRRRFEAGDVILREGEPGAAFYVIELGTARVLKRDPLDPRGDFVEVARLSEGELFGEFAVLADRRRHATVTALTGLSTLEISQPLLARLVRKYPEVGPILDSYYRERLIENLIATAPFLRAIEESRRADLVQQFLPRKVAAGEAIVNQGDRAGGFYLIVLGGVEIRKKVGSSTVISVATLREGDYFGELGLLRGDVARASVVATGKTELAMLPPQSFYELVSEHPVLWEQVRAEAHRRELALYELVAGTTGKS